MVANESQDPGATSASGDSQVFPWTLGKGGMCTTSTPVPSGGTPGLILPLSVFTVLQFWVWLGVVWYTPCFVVLRSTVVHTCVQKVDVEQLAKLGKVPALFNIPKTSTKPKPKPQQGASKPTPDMYSDVQVPMAPHSDKQGQPCQKIDGNKVTTATGHLLEVWRGSKCKKLWKEHRKDASELWKPKVLTSHQQKALWYCVQHKEPTVPEVLCTAKIVKILQVPDGKLHPAYIARMEAQAEPPVSEVPESPKAASAVEAAEAAAPPQLHEQRQSEMPHHCSDGICFCFIHTHEDPTQQLLQSCDVVAELHAGMAA